MRLHPYVLLLTMLTLALPVWAAPAFTIDTGGSCSEATLLDADAGSSRPPASDVRDPIFYPGDTERLKPLLGKLARNMWIDQKEIWTSPFHMNRRTAPLWLGFTAATAALIATDSQTSTILENSKGQVRAGNLVSKTGAAYTVIPTAAAFYLTGVLVDNQKARETGVLGAEAMLDGIIVYGVVKTVASRNRPNSVKDAGKFFSGGSSFPSGHAMTSWAFASVVAHEYAHTRVVPIIAYGLAAMVTGARIAARQHYASDVLAGGAAGWFIGTYVYHTHELHLGHHHGLAARFVPEVEPGTRTYALGLNLGRSDAR